MAMLVGFEIIFDSYKLTYIFSFVYLPITSLSNQL